MKKFRVFLISGILAAAYLCPAASAEEVNIEAARSSVYINDMPQYFDAYNIDGNNYFKLRDIAYSVSGSEKQFEVTWDADRNAVGLISGIPYTAVGDEMQRERYASRKTAIPATSEVYLDGKEIFLTAYNIDGSNYFKLRDLGEALDFSVEWDGGRNAIYIETMYDYSPADESGYELMRDTGAASTSISHISNYGQVSPVQQFLYTDEGLAYAYEKEGRLEIVTPSGSFSVDMLHSLLGDVISDDDGNFYVVWGDSNQDGGTDTETVFISKYSASGKLKKTVGFTGKSIMGSDGNTKIPFNAGGCSSAIGGGRLMVNYARTMYSGHQSNNVIGVNLSDMSPVKWQSEWNIPYTSHSFNQSVVWDDDTNQFVYADQGDAYSRGFIITDDSGEKNIFHFYLQSNADYNMHIVNKTFAQMGGLVKTDRGLAFVGASAKSISASANDEPQNLFIQIFDPTKKLSKSMFVGGEERVGATSFDINDNQNKPLTDVTDYGVRWLTDYIDRDVISPRAVSAGDRVAIMWNESAGSVTSAHYMVLSDTGKVITPPTSIGNMRLNSAEPPVYYDGKIYWASSSGNGIIRVLSLEI